MCLLKLILQIWQCIRGRLRGGFPLVCLFTRFEGVPLFAIWLVCHLLCKQLYSKYAQTTICEHNFVHFHLAQSPSQQYLSTLTFWTSFCQYLWIWTYTRFITCFALNYSIGTFQIISIKGIWRMSHTRSFSHRPKHWWLHHWLPALREPLIKSWNLCFPFIYKG